MNLDQTDTLVSIAVGITILMGVVLAWLRWVRPPLKKVVSRTVAGIDMLAGRDAIIDNLSGRELAPALPSIGQRMDTIERAVATLAEQHEQITALTGRMDAVESDVQQLKDGTIERVATKAESVAAWRAVEAVAKQGPGDEPELE